MLGIDYYFVSFTAIDERRGYVLPVQKVQQVHQDQAWQEVEIHLAEELSGHLPMPFRTLGDVSLINHILLRLLDLLDILKVLGVDILWLCHIGTGGWCWLEKFIS